MNMTTDNDTEAQSSSKGIRTNTIKRKRTLTQTLSCIQMQRNTDIYMYEGCPENNWPFWIFEIHPRGLDITWQLVTEDRAEHPWTVVLPRG